MFQREGFLGAIGIAFSVIGGTGDLLVKEWQHRAEFREGCRNQSHGPGVAKPGHVLGLFYSFLMKTGYI